MELPFYYSFAEFQENYSSDFDRWRGIYIEGSELDFVNELISLYGIFVDEDGNYKHGISLFIIDDRDYILDNECSIDDYAENINLKLSEWFEWEGIRVDWELPHGLTVLDYWEISNEDHIFGGFRIGDPRHKYFKHFFSVDGLSVVLDHLQYRNFTFSVLKIYEFLQNKSKTLKRIEVLEVNKSAELPITEPYKEKERGVNVPYKLALLDELGFIKGLNLQYPNKSDIYRILQFLTGGNIDNVTDYYNSIYGNYSGSNQITDKHREKVKDLYYK